MDGHGDRTVGQASSFVAPYCDYAERLTDAPPRFHQWTAISLLAATLGNDCWARVWGRRMCPNLWVILLAGSGIFRKTTALNIGDRVLRAALPDAFWPSSWSFESLLETMQNTPGGLLLVREFRRFHAALTRDYAGGSKELLVDAYDNPERDVRKTKTGGEQPIEFPAPNILAASTLEWFESSMRSDDVAGGYLARMMVIPGDQPAAWKGIVLGQHDDSTSALVEHLTRVQGTMQGEVSLSDIYRRLQSWLRAYERKQASRGVPPGLEGTMARAGANVVKLAMVMQADIEPSLVIGRPALERAIELVEFANEQMQEMLETGLVIGMGPDAEELRTVENIIKSAGTIDHSAALKRFRKDARRFERHIKTLEQRDQVQAIQTTTAGRPKKVYRWAAS